jgi:hypothetical protein
MFITKNFQQLYVEIQMLELTTVAGGGGKFQDKY